MTVTLFEPGKPPRTISPEGFTMIATIEHSRVDNRVAQELGCPLGLVDILDCSDDYIAYSIFDYEGQPNPLASDALRQISIHNELYCSEYEELQGPILLITRN